MPRTPTTVIASTFLLLAGAAPLMAQPGAAAQPALPRWSLELEAGPAWQTLNDVRIPNDDSATRFSLVDAVGKGPWTAARIYLAWRLDENDELRALYAPLTIDEPAQLAGDVSFAGGAFAAGAAQATYKFNSYRVTYRHRFHEGDRWTWWWGGTAKIRDARIALAQAGVTAAKDDLGFVPLLHVAGQWRPAEGWSLLLDVDAIAGGPGRAEDASLKLARDLGDRAQVAVGYRLVEGGADVDAVYTFAWLHYAVASVRVVF
ncbi:MAG: hypothetical protein IPK64_04060 [bacterium]|nr:hypothetical protein [bacterium]